MHRYNYFQSQTKQKLPSQRSHGCLVCVSVPSLVVLPMGGWNDRDGMCDESKKSLLEAKADKCSRKLNDGNIRLNGNLSLV